MATMTCWCHHYPHPHQDKWGLRLEPQVCYFTYMFLYILLKITLQPKTKWIQQRWQGVNGGSRHDVSRAPGMFFIIYCLLNDHQQHHCFVFCFIFHCSASVAWKNLHIYKSLLSLPHHALPASFVVSSHANIPRAYTWHYWEVAS